MGFHVDRFKVDQMYIEFASVANSLFESLTEVKECMDAFKTFQFEGEGAAEIKNYLSNVHGEMIYLLNTLAGQLLTDYSTKYMARFDEQPVCENAHALFPEDEMESKRGCAAYEKDTRIPYIQEQIDAVFDELPSGVSIQRPSTARIIGPYRTAHDEVEQVKNAVRTIEDEGKNLFESKSGEFADLANATQRLFGAAKNQFASSDSLKSYTDQQFADIVERTNISESLAASLEDQMHNLDAMISVAHSAAERAVLREDEMREVLKGDMQFWEDAGIVGGIGLVIAGTAAAVFTGGIAAPFLFGGAVIESMDTGRRIRKRGRVTKQTEEERERYEKVVTLAGDDIEAGVKLAEGDVGGASFKLIKLIADAEGSYDTQMQVADYLYEIYDLDLTGAVGKIGCTELCLSALQDTADGQVDIDTETMDAYAANSASAMVNARFLESRYAAHLRQSA